jgi:lysozyme
MSKVLFDVIRHIKGSALTQGEVDMVISALSPAPPPPAAAPGNGRRVSAKGINLLHSFENCKLQAYPDPGSIDGHPWTIGWGSTGPDIKKGLVWTQQQADDRFARDLGRFEKGVAMLAKNTTTNQFDALVSFAYNVGLGALGSSTLLKLHNAGNYGGAAAQFARWNKNDGKVMRGLTRRRTAEAALYKS